MKEIVSFLLSFKQYESLLYVMVFFVPFFESLVFVGEFVPGTLFAVSIGFLASKGILDIYLCFIFGSLGIILSDFASYYLALFFYDKLSRANLLKKHKSLILKGEKFFKNHGGKSILASVFIGALRPIVPFVAGMLNMKKDRFALWVIFSGLLWGLCYFGIGYFFGKDWNVIEHFLKRFNIILLVLLGIGIPSYLIRKKK